MTDTSKRLPPDTLEMEAVRIIALQSIKQIEGIHKQLQSVSPGTQMDHYFRGKLEGIQSLHRELVNHVYSY